VFFRIWTRKEAYLKACGAGLSVALDSFDVPTDPQPRLTLTRSALGPAELARWQFQAIPAPRGFASALVIEQGPVELGLHDLW
jgi:4'-phosphopantetheinyl transferase